METRLQSGTCDYLGKTKVCSGNYWQRDGRLTAKLALPDQNLILGVGDTFTVDEIEYQVKTIELLETGDYLVIESLPKKPPADTVALTIEQETAKRLRQERQKKVQDHTFAIPSRNYLELLNDLQRLTPEVLLRLSMDDQASFTVERWESEMTSEMHRNLKEGDMGPNTCETHQAVLSQSEAQASTTVQITRWNPNSIANMSASAEWSVGAAYLFCSLHCSPDGLAHKACVIGPDKALNYIRSLLLPEAKSPKTKPLS